jgi:hypothetical protein
MGGMAVAWKILVGKPECKITFRRPRSRWDDNIRMNFRKNRVGRCGQELSSSG